MEKNERTFEGLDKDGKTVKVLLKTPDARDHKNAQKSYNQAFRIALESDGLLRQKLDQFAEEQGIWNEQKQKQNDEYVERINSMEELLQKGGIRLAEAKKIAMELKSLRIEFRGFLAERNSLDQLSVEGQAENARFAEIVRICMLDPNTRKPFFLTQDDYDTSSDEPWVLGAASELASIIYGLDPDYDNNLTENKFLKEFDFVNDDLDLINKDGHLVDSEGRLINDEGRYVAYREDGEQYFVNREGAEVVQTSGEDGAWVRKDLAERMPFLDENDNPIISAKKEDVEKEEDLVASETIEAKTPKAKTKTDKKTVAEKGETSD